MKKIDDDYHRYMSAYGMCTDNVDGVAGFNDILFTAEKIEAYFQHGELKGKSVQKFNAVIAKCTIEAGLYRANPDSLEHISHDNVRGILFMLFRLKKKPELKAWIQYGRKHGWVYNNVAPGKWNGSTFFGRFPDMITMAKLSIDEIETRPSVAEFLWWVLIMLRTVIFTPKRVEPWKWAYFRCETGKAYGGVYGWLARLWERVFLWKKPGGLGQVIGEWTPDWAAHPTAKYLKPRS